MVATEIPFPDIVHNTWEFFIVHHSMYDVEKKNAEACIYSFVILETFILSY